MQRENILKAYRELLYLIKQLPSSQSMQALQEAKTTMKQHVLETNPSTLDVLYKQLASRISFLRSVTPKRRRNTESVFGTEHYVLRDGKLVPGSGATNGSRVSDGSISMSEARQKHNELLRRQHFGRAPPRYNPSSF